MVLFLKIIYIFIFYDDLKIYPASLPPSAAAALLL